MSISRLTEARWLNFSPWIGLRDNRNQKRLLFTIEYRLFSCIFSHHPILSGLWSKKFTGVINSWSLKPLDHNFNSLVIYQFWPSNHPRFSCNKSHVPIIVSQQILWCLHVLTIKSSEIFHLLTHLFTGLLPFDPGLIRDLAALLGIQVVEEFHVAVVFAAGEALAHHQQVLKGKKMAVAEVIGDKSLIFVYT